MHHQVAIKWAISQQRFSLCPPQEKSKSQSPIGDLHMLEQMEDAE